MSSLSADLLSQATHWPCHWNWCRKSFGSKQQLEDHVNDHILCMKPIKRENYDEDAFVNRAPPKFSTPDFSSAERAITPERIPPVAITTTAASSPEPTTPDTADRFINSALASQRNSPRSERQGSSPVRPPNRHRFSSIDADDERRPTPSPSPIPPSPSIDELLVNNGETRRQPNTRDVLPIPAPASPSPTKSKRPRSPLQQSHSPSPSPTKKSRYTLSPVASSTPSPKKASPAATPTTGTTNLTPDTKRLQVGLRFETKSPPVRQPLFHPITPSTENGSPVQPRQDAPRSSPLQEALPIGENKTAGDGEEDDDESPSLLVKEPVDFEATGMGDRFSDLASQDDDILNPRFEDDGEDPLPKANFVLQTQDPLQWPSSFSATQD